MISLVLYGRNDSYGYNLHKRAALSLNCMAEVLTDPDDEILFVDYNTPDDYPTFPEAIEDTLTEKAMKMLRIFRVRPSLHAQFEHKTHLKALEPISRNIAIRRSNPANRWILSTNTDMIFVPREGNSISDIVRNLESGYWAVPRFEVPESLWESFDRKDPISVIKAINHWGQAAHLNEIVMGADENLFDAPGDFQLVERDVLFRINGFDERMLLGWHVDSNLAKRLNLYYGKTSDLSQKIFGYHCDHTRQVTPMHRHKSVENSLGIFVDSVSNPTLPTQFGWGFPKSEIEEIRLEKSSASLRYINAIQNAITSEMINPSRSFYRTEFYDRVDYDPNLVIAFLADLFVNLQSGTIVAWFGYRKDTFNAFRKIWESIGFSEQILVDDYFARELIEIGTNPKDVRIVARETALNHAEIIVVDFNVFQEKAPFGEIIEDDEKIISEKSCHLIKSFFEIKEFEYERMRSINSSRQIVTINAFFNRFENMVQESIASARTPFLTRIKHGFLIPELKEENLLPKMFLGSAGERMDKGEIQAVGEGLVFYGPYLTLISGVYELEGTIEFSQTANLSKELLLEVVTAFTNEHQERLAFTQLYFKNSRIDNFKVSFDVFGGVFNSNGFPAKYEFRLFSPSTNSIVIRSLKLRRIRDKSFIPSFIGEDLLPRLLIGEAGIRRGMEIESRKDTPGCVFFGPYFLLPSGKYRLDCHFTTTSKKLFRKFNSKKEKIYLEVVVGHPESNQVPVATLDLFSAKKKNHTISLEFEVKKDKDSQSNSYFYEFRLWTNGQNGIGIDSVKLYCI